MEDFTAINTCCKLMCNKCHRNGFGSSVNAACNHRFRISFFSGVLISCTVLFLFPIKSFLCSSGRMPLLDLDVEGIVLQ